MSLLKMPFKYIVNIHFRTDLRPQILPTKSFFMKTDDLIYGELYALWRDGIYLGRAYWTKDEIHGDCFLVDVEKDGMKMKQVFIADSWVKANLE